MKIKRRAKGIWCLSLFFLLQGLFLLVIPYFSVYMVAGRGDFDPTRDLLHFARMCAAVYFTSAAAIFILNELALYAAAVIALLNVICLRGGFQKYGGSVDITTFPNDLFFNFFSARMAQLLVVAFWFCTLIYLWNVRKRAMSLNAASA